VGTEEDAMSSRALGIVVLLLSGPAVAETPPEAEPPDRCADCRELVFGFDFLPFGGTSLATRGNEVRRVSFNLIGGYAGALDGFELSSVASIERTFVRGVQIAGAANVVGGPVEGGQVAGAVNIAGEAVDGVQVAGAVNLAAGAVDGAQIAGGLNVGGDVRGTQIAGGVNVAGAVTGVQIAPINLASGKVRGVQVGVVNVAEDADASIGVLNLLWAGRWTVDVWSGDAGLANLAVRNGGRYTHSFLTAGRLAFGTRSVWSAGFGMGLHLPANDWLAVEVDAFGRALYQPERGFDRSGSFLGTVRLALEWSPLDALALFAGPSFNVLLSEHLAPEPLSSLDAWQLHEGRGRRHDYRPDVYLWPGFELGVRLILN